MAHFLRIPRIGHTLFCFFLMLCLVTGCTESTDAPAVPDSSTVVKVDNLDPSGLRAIAMSAGPELLLTDIDYTRPALSGDRVWFFGESRTEHSPALAGVATDGSEHFLLPLTLPAADRYAAEDLPAGETAAVTYQPLDSDGTLPLLLRRILHTAADTEAYQLYGTEYFLSRIDETGSVEEGIALAAPYETVLQYPCIAGDLLWFCSSAWNAEKTDLVTPQLLGFSITDGSLSVTLDLPQNLYVTGLHPTEDGQLWLLAMRSKTADGRWNTMDPGLYPVYAGDGAYSLGTALTVPGVMATGEVGFVRGFCGEDLWLYGAGGLYRWNTVKNSCRLEHRWSDTGIRSDTGSSVAPSSAFIFSDGSFLLTNHTYDFSTMRDVVEIWLLGETADTPSDERAVLRIGSLLTDNRALLAAAAAFNESNPSVRAEVVTYTTEAAAQKGAADSITLLERELLTGKGPDVLVTGAGQTMLHLNGKGIFVDLYPLLDADPALSREDFAAGPLSAGEWNGALYSVIPEYGLLSVVGNAEKLGNTAGWTWDEFYQCTQYAELPFWGLGRDILLHYFLQAGGSRFIDYAAETAHFDSPEFIRLLEDMAKYPETMPLYTESDQKERFISGASLVSVCFPSFGNVRGDIYTFNGPVVYKGFPTDEGYGGLLLPTMQLSICSSTENADASWTFISYFLRPDYQSGIYLGLPLRRDALAAMAQKAQQPYMDEDPDDGMTYCIPHYLDQATTNQAMIDYWSHGVTPQEAAQILEAAENTDTVFHYNSTVYDIVMESAAAFFAGQSTAEEAAALIQSRVQTYLAEQG